jgi:hypothetical protein
MNLKYFIAFSLCLPMLVEANSLTIGDTTYPNSCSKAEWVRVKKKLIKYADGRSQEQLIKAAYTYLCGHGDVAIKELLLHSPKTILSLSTGSGQDPTKEFVRAAEAVTPQGGNVWGVEVSMNDALINLTFWPDEACIKSITFMPKTIGWLITQIEESCD